MNADKLSFSASKKVEDKFHMLNQLGEYRSSGYRLIVINTELQRYLTAIFDEVHSVNILELYS